MGTCGTWIISFKLLKASLHFSDEVAVVQSVRQLTRGHVAGILAKAHLLCVSGGIFYTGGSSVAHTEELEAFSI